jgi:hypothetical protein
VETDDEPRAEKLSCGAALTCEFFSTARSQPRLRDRRSKIGTSRILPFTAEHALHLFDLPIHHGDPWDRQIIAPSLGRENSGCHSR